MRRPIARLAAACALSVAMLTLTGSAVAGGGNSANAPGQQKQDQAAAQPPATAQTPPGQAKKASTSSSTSSTSHSSPGQAKQTAKASSSSSGVKPASGTTKWTHCVTGTSTSGVTCTSSDSGHTPQTKADVSKQYGNGKTAAQIAVSRGGTNVQLTGPGNSQPHKVSVCGKPTNKSGGVDVHAVKSYDTSACQPTPPPAAPCGYVVVANTTAASHGHGKGLSHNKHSKTTYSLQADSTQSCGQEEKASTPPPPPCTTCAPSNNNTSNNSTRNNSTSNNSTSNNSTSNNRSAPRVTPIAGTAAASSTPPGNSGVLGAQTTLATPKTHAHHGVLGTVANVAGSSLPFTGFPVWLAALIALALILAGIAFRRRGLRA